jgi:hypothetical protein
MKPKSYADPVTFVMLTKYTIKSSILLIENIFFFQLPSYFFQYHFGFLRITWTRNFLFSSNADSRALAPNLITITNFFSYHEDF